jgi:inner membrane protein
MTSWITSGGTSFWIVLGLVLIAVETIAPGFFLLWLGLAAVATGLTLLVVTLGWQGAALLFVLYAAISIALGWRMMRTGFRSPSDASQLNNRGPALVGQTFTLDRPLLGGEGQMKVGDSVWRITGPDMVTGAKVRVTGIDGVTLVVAPF